MRQRPAVCLTIGGSDSCGGAGIQADLRMFDRLAVRGCSVITALTAQNPAQISHIEAVSVTQIKAELAAIFNFFDVQVVKTGMLFNAECVECVATALHRFHPSRPLIVDPVMVASSGKTLLDQEGIDAIQQLLIPQATLLTPNLDEAAVLLGTTMDDAAEAASSLLMRYRCAVLLKGGHKKGAKILHDFLCMKSGDVYPFSHEAQAWGLDQAHGTGCRLAATIAGLMARGEPLAAACEQAVSITQKQQFDA